MNSRMVKFDKRGNFLMDWGSLGSEIGQFRLPHTMVVDRAGEVYVGDRSNSRIQVFDSDGKFLRVLLMNVPYTSDYQPPFTGINAERPVRGTTQPWAMCLTESTPQELWVSDAEPGRIYRMRRWTERSWVGLAVQVGRWASSTGSTGWIAHSWMTACFGSRT